MTPQILIDSTVAGEPRRFIRCKLRYAAGNVDFHLDLAPRDRNGSEVDAFKPDLREFATAILQALERPNGVAIRELR